MSRPLRSAAIAFALAASWPVPEPALAQSPAPAGPRPLCVVSTDREYARTPEKPAQVGGSPMFGGARQRRYLESLRGPAGQPIRFVRLPAVDAPDGETLIDRYEVTYEGLAAPEILHLDWYRYSDLRAPSGFICGQAFNLGLPPPDPFLAADQLERLALTSGQGSDRPAPPIDLGGRGPKAAGVAFDHFRLVERAARTAVQAGTPLVAGEVPREISKPHSVVLAYPQVCDGRTVSASRVRLEDPRGRQTAAEVTEITTEAIAKLVSGFDAPRGTVAAVFPLDGPRAGVAVTATYPDACSGTTEELTLELETASARLLESPMPSRPAGDPAIGTWVAVQALIDHDGRFREATALGGPPDLTRAAVDAVQQWRAEPPRVNGAPLASPVVLQLTFRATP